MVKITVNGVQREVQAPDDTPLLYVLRNDLQLSGPQFGCGLAQCGACSVLIDGKETRSCVTPISTITANQEITTLEGLPARWAKQKGLSAAEAKDTLHPVQQAWIEEQTPLVRILPKWNDDRRNRTPREQPKPNHSANQGSLHHIRAIAPSLPLRKLHRHY